MLKKNKIFETASLILLSLSGIVLIALQNSLGWIALWFWILSLLWCRKNFAKDISLIYISLIILAFTKIGTSYADKNIISMTIGLTLAILIPCIISRYVYKSHIIKFRFFNGRRWTWKEILYLIVAIIIAYFLIPFYFIDTQSHLNWTVETGNYNLYKLFAGTNIVGIWDELFFVSLSFWILKKWIPFWWANLVQAILFSSFLYELGFKDWGCVWIFIFALIQWTAFQKSKSLFYMISIHLSVDFILFLALLHAHKPDWPSIFIY